MILHILYFYSNNLWKEKNCAQFYCRLKISKSPRIPARIPEIAKNVIYINTFNSQGDQVARYFFCFANFSLIKISFIIKC